jgi:2-polyprenyl-3-methyl-5-hydroxy-6-metoxy-1,4-benzoquinol methylase
MSHAMARSIPDEVGPDFVESCPACNAKGLRIFHEQQGVPVHSCRLVATREEAEAFPRGSLRLGLCLACGFITNTAYDAALQSYFVGYEETQGFSPRFREFMVELADRWIDRYDLEGKDVLEIGCGKGEFLVAMCERGVGRGTGIDPAIVPERVESAAASRMTFIEDLYGEKYAHLTGDAVVCRHTLEHIHPVADFLRVIRRSLEGRPDTAVLFELPDALRVLRECAFWDVYYEHCSYFTPGSLASLFRTCGFDVLALELDYDDQYILIEAKPRDGNAQRLQLEESPAEVAAAVGVTDGIGCVVDINPYKHGKFMAGTGHEIVAPDALRDYRPDLVVAMNPIYLDEIRDELHRLGVTARLEAV